jgi:hypothetical protein
VINSHASCRLDDAGMILEVVAGTGFEPAHLRIMSMVGLAGLEPARMLLRRQVLYPLSYNHQETLAGLEPAMLLLCRKFR